MHALIPNIHASLKLNFKHKGCIVKCVYKGCVNSMCIFSETGLERPLTHIENKRPMSLDALLENQLGHLPNFHIYSLSTPWVEIALIFTLGGVVSEIQADFQNCNIWALNLAIGQSTRSCTYTLFPHQGVEI